MIHGICARDMPYRLLIKAWLAADVNYIGEVGRKRAACRRDQATGLIASNRWRNIVFLDSAVSPLARRNDNQPCQQDMHGHGHRNRRQ